LNDSLQAFALALRNEGYTFAPAAAMREAVGRLPVWDAFAASWNDMPRDEHLPDGHRYRRRRHATLTAASGERGFRVEVHQAHYQGVEYNPLVGGIERWFEPIRPEVLASAAFASIMGFCLELFGPFRPHARWKVECHQFRIEARPEAAGLPTPEGVHRDGVDFVLVLLVSRVNIESGTTTVHSPDGRTLGAFTLAEPLDAALVDDSRVMHGVTPVQPFDPAKEAHRDVLVITFREALH
jgi:hypothetical protein